MSHRIHILDSDVWFDAEPNQSLLDAALRCGVELPYSCRKGVCGQCLGKIVSGDVETSSGHPDMNCSTEEVLYCCAQPRSDITIAPTEWRRSEPGARKRYNAKVFRNTLASPGVSVLELRLPAGQRVRFKAGQYLHIILPNGERRSYSMANAPHQSDVLQLHIRHVPGGLFSGQVQQLNPGDVLAVEIPFGQFHWREDSTRPIVFIAASTGLAPIKSMVDDMIRRKIQRPIRLFWGVRDAQDLYSLAFLQTWAKQRPDMQLSISVESGEGGQWPGHRTGRLDDALLASVSDLTDHEVYCCGSPGMIEAMRVLCSQRLGLPREHFHCDVFVSGPTLGLS